MSGETEGRSRGDFLKLAGLGAALVAAGTAGEALTPERAKAAVDRASGEPGWLQNQEQVVDSYMEQFLNAVPYPTSVMRDSLERRNLVARLERFNKADKVGYLYVMSFGKFVGYYVVKGKISSVQSQLTPSNKVFDADRGSGTAEVVTESPGDDGSWGPNEGGDRGVFFFTSSGVMVETTLDWIYSDAPLNIDVPNLLAKGK